MPRTDATANVPKFFAPPAGTTIFPGSYFYGYSGAVVNGSDSTGDGSIGKPYASPQMASDDLFENYDFHSEYTGLIIPAMAPLGSQYFYPRLSMSGPLLGQPGGLPPLIVGPGHPNYNIGKYNPFTLQGDPGNPLGAIICSGDFGFDANGPAIGLSDDAYLKIVGVTVDSGVSQQDCIDIMRGCSLEIANVLFGATGNSGGNIHLGCAFDSDVYITGNLQINGSAASWCQLGENSSLYTNNNTGEATPALCTIVNNLVFPAGFLSAAGDCDYFISLNFQGPPTGQTSWQSTPSGVGVTLGANSVPVLLTDASTCDTAGRKNIPGTTAPQILDSGSVYK